jgi:signal peptidase II
MTASASLQAPPASPGDSPAGRHGPAWAVFVGICLSLLAADLLSKHYAFLHVASEPIIVDPQGSSNLAYVPQPPEGRVLLPHVLSLKLTLNDGALFGIGKGKRWFFIIVTLFAVVFILTVFARSDRRMRVLHVALAMVLAGALGNLYDRLQYSAVRDLLYLFPGVNLPLGMTWPFSGGLRGLYPWIFNIADVSLVIGVCLLMVLMWRSPPPAPGKPAGPR